VLPEKLAEEFLMLGEHEEELFDQHQQLKRARK
jgi:hypothetical protein